MKKQVISGVKWTTIGTIVLAVTALVKISVLARFLSKEDFGLMAMVTLVLGFMNLFNDMGLTTAILHKQNITKKVYSSLYWFNALVSLGMYAVLWLLTPLVALFYEEPQLNQLIPLLGLNLLLSAIGRMFKTIEQKNLLFKQINIIDITAAGLSLIFAIYLAVEGYGVYALVYSALLQYSLSNVMLLLLGLKKYGLQLHYRFIETRPFLKIGMYQVGGQTINYFNRDLDILIIGKFFSAEVLGGYSLARELVRKPVVIINPILNKVGAPALANFSNNRKKLKEYYLKLVNLTASLSIPLYSISLLAAPFLVAIVYGNDFGSIVGIVQILCVNMIFRMISGVVGNLVIATGRTDLDFKWNLLTLIVSPIFIFIGVLLGSIEWVAVMVTVGSIALYIPSWFFYVRRLIGVSLKEYSKAFFLIKRIRLSHARI